MKEIKLNKGFVAKVSDKDYSRVKQFNWFAKEDPRGRHNTIYARRNIQRPDGTWTDQTLHRFILGITDRKVEVDHRDRNGLNCQRGNLRKATHGQNRHNSCKSRNNTSGFKGVIWESDRMKWTARIMVEGTSRRVGRFNSAKEASEAYDEAVKVHCGKFAVTNKSLGASA
jgi:AP2 domain